MNQPAKPAESTRADVCTDLKRQIAALDTALDSWRRSEAMLAAARVS